MSNPLQLTEELFALWIFWCLPAIYTNSRRTVHISPEDDLGLDEEVNEFENNIRAFTAVCVCINSTRALVMDLQVISTLSFTS